ncbi:hypothetical protein J2Y45_001163 [Dyadobacter sp. BE34]|uniref:Lipoprotein n=1 Tax=Dyadobacter fermentans TaxID=94254 RepID=A0ABU1QRX8_9BACT|nr:MULTISPECIES: hypothetical protein [Dyadobacter]MDR6803894.1 hypothetical protein [Dyadobacter fermentans]MDR7041634.1 hypothetical protein [Dyadobacter sp. BE242]MDR7196037.1 hypothetical protein [Dyadobacter sp. BE34]MDR7213418.1 hypothetical protein [Dyadobacter sp. BE31]MDR7261443.1 hypothetical protein [Dyadobacter sp. BE32]
MKKSLLLFVILVAVLCCKSHRDKDSENTLEAGNYLLVDSERYLLDSLSVTYQNVPEGRSYQLMAINRSSGVFVAVQYLILNTNQDFLAGEFAYKNSKDLKNLQRNHFYNIVVRCKVSNGAMVLLDGLGGAVIEGGAVKVAQDGKAFYLLVACTINERKVMFRYEGTIKSEEFDW